MKLLLDVEYVKKQMHSETLISLHIVILSISGIVECIGPCNIDRGHQNLSFLN